ncbi:MAG: hypothetical protein JNN01_20640 [Opitutaceae bacterium]|nr:hypothetical protein [Opitutaceae bacterium]
MIPLPAPWAERFPEDLPLFSQAATGSAGAPSDVFRRRGLAVATAACALRLHARPENLAFHQKVWDPADAAVTSTVCPRLGLVPGAFYREHPGTGADGARILRILKSLGHEAELIPIPSFGRTADTAGVIRDWLARSPPEGSVLVSLSKGACDVKAALADPVSVRHLRGWISLSGLGSGTPLVQWLRRRPWRWAGIWLILRLRGHSIAALRDLEHDPDGVCAPWPTLPPGRPLVHVQGIPLPHHLHHPWARRGHRRLAPLGPNDGGGVLLADVERWPGIVHPVWGADHYLQPGWPLEAELTRVFQAFLHRCG